MGDFTKSVLSLLSPDTRQGLLFLTGAWLLVLTMLFLAAFVLPVPSVAYAIRQLGLPEWVYGTLLVLAVHGLVVFLGSNDVLYYGNASWNKFSAAFQRHLPSKHIQRMLDVDERVAGKLWFDEFNSWSHSDHPRHQDRSRTFQRGYACRFVYYVQTAAQRLFWLGFAWVAFVMVYCSVSEVRLRGLNARVLVLVILASVWIALRYLNPLGPNASGGVWRRFDEINLRHCAWIDDNADLFTRKVEGSTDAAA